MKRAGLLEHELRSQPATRMPNLWGSNHGVAVMSIRMQWLRVLKRQYLHPLLTDAAYKCKRPRRSAIKCRREKSGSILQENDCIRQLNCLMHVVCCANVCSTATYICRTRQSGKKLSSLTCSLKIVSKLFFSLTFFLFLLLTLFHCPRPSEFFRKTRVLGEEACGQARKGASVCV